MGVCARYWVNPKELYLKLVKRIIKYVNETLDYSLWYPFDSPLVIIDYFVVDEAKNVEDRRSTLGASFFVSDYLVAWLSKKQNLVFFSIMEAKYIVVGSCIHLLWMKQMFSDYGIEQDIMNVMCDNLSAINISNNLVFHSQTKYIEIQHHFIKDFIEDKAISLEFILIEHQLVDIFTKPLDYLRFEFLRKSLGICFID